MAKRSRRLKDWRAANNSIRYKPLSSIVTDFSAAFVRRAKSCLLWVAFKRATRIQTQRFGNLCPETFVDAERIPTLWTQSKRPRRTWGGRANARFHVSIGGLRSGSG